MKFKIYFIFMAAMLVNAPQVLKADDVIQVLFLGDSLTAGYGIDQSKSYPNLIQDIANTEGIKLGVTNAGMSGDTTAGALQRLPWLLKNRINVSIVALGANDGLRGLPIAEMKGNLRKIIDKLKSSNPEMKIILAGMKLPLNFGETYINDFESAFVTVSKERNVIFLPFLLEGVAGVPSLSLEDRLHPSEEGHVVMAALVWSKLKELVK